MMGAATHPGYVRESNQDAVLARALRAGAVLAVADGVGGQPGGELASRLAIAAVSDTLAAAPPGGDPAELLAHACRAAHERVRAGRVGAHAQMCTTLVAALVRDDRAWVANVGDSRAYAYRDGTLTQLTADHSWVEQELRAGRLERDDPRVDGMRHVITRTIGGEATLAADRFGPLTLARGDALLLCSDGLHGYVGDGAIAHALAPPEGDAVQRLIARALEHGGVDNVGVALFVAE